MIALYWEIGRRITEQQAALGWGKSVVETLSSDIQKEFPGIQGFGVRNMWDMAHFSRKFKEQYHIAPSQLKTLKEKGDGEKMGEGRWEKYYSDIETSSIDRIDPEGGE